MVINGCDNLCNVSVYSSGNEEHADTSAVDGEGKKSTAEPTSSTSRGDRSSLKPLNLKNPNVVSCMMMSLCTHFSFVCVGLHEFLCVCEEVMKLI